MSFGDCDSIGWDLMLIFEANAECDSANQANLKDIV